MKTQDSTYRQSKSIGDCGVVAMPGKAVARNILTSSEGMKRLLGQATVITDLISDRHRCGVWNPASRLLCFTDNMDVGAGKHSLIQDVCLLVELKPAPRPVISERK